MKNGLNGFCRVVCGEKNNSCGVTIATYSLPDLYLPKMKNVLLDTPETNGLTCACAV